MKRLILMLVVSCFAACGGDSTETPESLPKDPIDIPDQPAPPVFSENGGSSSYRFTAKTNWTAGVTATRAADWCSVSPTSGGKGDVTLSIVTKPNDTPDERNATITLRAGEASKSFSISQKQKDALTVTSSKIEIDAKGGAAYIEVKANISFQYEIGADAVDWVSFVGTRAMQTSQLEFMIAENDDTAVREGTIIIRSSEGAETMKIYQSGAAPVLVLTQKDYTVAAAGETIKVELKSNVDYTVTMPQVGWIKESTTRAMSTHTLYYTISANEDYDGRSAEIIFTNKANNLTQKVTVSQVQKDAIVLAKSEYEFAADGGVLDFDVMTNVELTIAISPEAKSWITQVQTRGLEKRSLHFDIAAGSHDNDRTGTISITGGGITQKVTVTQSGRSEILNKERVALMALYRAMNGAHWTNSTNWDSEKPVGEWHGITCDDNGRVKYLNLSSNNLEGYIPNEIGDLSFMKALSLDDNLGLSGSLPKIMGQLHELESFSIPNCNLTGEIPEELFSDTQLWSVKLKGNKLTGTIPASFVKVLDRYRNSLTSAEWPLPDNASIHIHNNSSPKLTAKSPATFSVFAGSSYDFGKSIIIGDYPDKTSYSYMDCDFEPYIQMERNNFSGDIPAVLADNEKWQSTYMAYLTLYQNEKYGFNLKSTKLGIPNHVKFQCIDGEIFTKESCSKHKYTMVINVYSEDLIYTSLKFKKDFRAYILRHSGSYDNTPSIIEQYGLNWNVAYGLSTSSSKVREYINCYKSTFATIKYPVLMLFDEHAKLVFHAAGDEKTIYKALDAFLVENLGDPQPSHPKANEIFYTSTDGRIVTPTKNNIDLKIISNTYTDRGVITCEEPIKEIENRLFLNCKRLKSIILPEGLTLIDGTQWPDNGAFESCPDLEKVVLPSSLTTLNNRAFAYCPKLTDITLPPNLTKIGGAAFMGCSSLTSISIPSRITTIEANLFGDCTALQSVSLPEGVLKIESAFRSCRSLTGCTLPASLQSLDGNAFTGCSALKSIVIPDGVTSKIDYVAFKDCSALERVVIGNGVPAIATEAFMNCSSLAELVIGSKVASIGISAFKDCASLRTLRIPDSVTTIGEGAFRGCSSLVTTTLGNSVSNIAENAFRDCTGHLIVNCDTDYEKFKNAFTGNQFTTAIFGDNVIRIAQNLLINSTALTTIVIGKQVKTINFGAFGNCIKLNNVSFSKEGSQLVEIGGAVFQDCISLTNLAIPLGVTTIGGGAFKNCSNLESIILPTELTQLSAGILFGCTKLRHLIIPEKVTEIQMNACRECKEITTITIPKNVSKIGYAAFWDCSLLSTIYCKPSTPPTYEPYPFASLSEKFRIYVPTGSLSKYVDGGWYYYRNYIYGHNFTD